MNKNLRYPDSAVVYEIEGTVIVDFIVSKEGKAYNFRVSQPVNKYLDAEALRVTKLMPDWAPAIFDGGVVQSEVVFVGVRFQEPGLLFFDD